MTHHVGVGYDRLMNVIGLTTQLDSPAARSDTTLRLGMMNGAAKR